MRRLDFKDGTFITLFENKEISTTDNDGSFINLLETKVPLGINAVNGIITLTPECVADGVYTKEDINGVTWEFKSSSSESYVKIGTTTVISFNSHAIVALSGDTVDNTFLITTALRQAANTLDFPNDAHGGNYERQYRAYGCLNSPATYESYLADLITKCNIIGTNTPNGAATRITSTNVIGTMYTTFYSAAPRTDRFSSAYYEIALPMGASVNGYLFSSTGVTQVGLLKTTDFNPENPSIDPYEGGGTSTTGGGDGTFDGSSDPVDIPPLPTVGATDAGFITLFAPTPSQLKALGEYMWSSAFDIEGGGTANAFKKLFNDPMECILGLSVVPVSVPTSGAREITVGNIVTTVQMNVASQQYIEVDCGSISFTNKYFGSYLDYEPYTKMAIFVPYSGVHAISADDVMGKTVTLKYHIDILTGSLVAFLKCGNSVLYEFNGACASNIPVNSLNYASTIENAIRIAVNIGTTVATAGAAAPATGALTGKAIAQGVALAGSTAEGALSMKPSIDRAGSLGGTTGLMGNQIPYIIITRPRLCRPSNQNKFKGYPSFIQVTLNDLIKTGYTEVDTVILDNLYLTNEEKEELENILYSGVFL